MRHGKGPEEVLDDDVNDKKGEDTEIRERIDEFVSSHLVTFGDGTFDALDSDKDDVIIKFFVDGSGGTATPRKDDSTNSEIFKFGTDLIVEVKFPYDFLFLSTIGIGPINLTSISTMKME